jgi:D-proline reductase (dithiol) PrdB
MAGIATIGVSIVRSYTEKVKPPRTVFLKWPFGHPLGEPFNVGQHRSVMIEMFNALYTMTVPGEIRDLPFQWKRDIYDEYSERQKVIKSIYEKESSGVIDNKELNDDLNKLYLIKRPVLWGTAASLSLLTIYFLILSLAESFSHSIVQFKELWYWIALLVSGFGIQAGLYTYIRGMMKLRKDSGIATSSVAAAGGLSTTSMAACCAHHIADVLPILGISAAVVFLNQFQNLFLTVGVLSNLIGINLMLKIIQKHGLFQEEQRVLPVLMKLNMNKSFYVVSTLSAFIFAITLYISI